MKDSDIDFSDIPKVGPDFFKNATLWRPREERNKREGEAHIPASFRKVTTGARKVKQPEKPRAKPARESSGR